MYASWLEANRELEPRYAEMYGRHGEWVERAIASHAKAEAKAKASSKTASQTASHIQMEGMERHTRCKLKDKLQPYPNPQP